MAHWIKKYPRDKCQVFICSKCKGECNCIHYDGGTKHLKINHCDYEYCPRCGEKIESEK